MQQNKLQEAKESFERADYLLNVTYPYIRDPKLLLSVLDALEDATIKGVQAVLGFEKVISSVAKDLNSQITLFKKHCMPKYDKKILATLSDLQKVQKARKDSSVEFRRKEKYVICSEKYDLNVIDAKSMEQYSNILRDFLNKIEGTIHV